jgi:membrane protease subunit HflK
VTRKIVIGVLAVLLVAYLLTGAVLVRSGERAVVRRFGRVLEEKPSPGLWIGLPWGMDRVDRVEVDRVHHFEVGYQPGADSGSGTPAGQLLTGDHNLINLQVVVDYSIIPGEVENYVVQMDRVEGLLARAVDTVLAEWVASRTVDEVLAAGRQVLPHWLVQQVQQRLQLYQLGIRLQNASVAYLAAPDEVKFAFDAVTQAQTKIRTTINEAEEKARRQERDAEAAKYRLEQEAAAYAAEQRRLAEADAAAFEARLAKYRQLRRANPDYLAGIWYDEMSKLFAQLRKDGRIDLLDRHLGADGLDITVMPPVPKKR